MRYSIIQNTTTMNSVLGILVPRHQTQQSGFVIHIQHFAI